jgi:hypothetical protein
MMLMMVMLMVMLPGERHTVQHTAARSRPTTIVEH